MQAMQMWIVADRFYAISTHKGNIAPNECGYNICITDFKSLWRMQDC